MSSAVLPEAALDPLPAWLPHRGDLLDWLSPEERGYSFLTQTPTPTASTLSPGISETVVIALLTSAGEEPSSAIRFAHDFDVDLIDRVFRETTARIARETLISTVSAKLGEHAAARFRRFMDYPDGWDSGHGRKLDPGSIDAFMRLLNIVDLPSKDAGLFMSPDGHVVVNWQSNQDDFIEIEIAPKALEVYFASGDREITVPLDEEAIRALPPFRREKHGA